MLIEPIVRYTEELSLINEVFFMFYYIITNFIGEHKC